MRIFTASIGMESNTFSAVPTGEQDYRDSVWYEPGEHPDEMPRECTAQLWVARRRAAADGFTLIEGSCFHASPGGRTAAPLYTTMRDTILRQMSAAKPLDALLLGIARRHGGVRLRRHRGRPAGAGRAPSSGQIASSASSSIRIAI